ATEILLRATPPRFFIEESPRRLVVDETHRRFFGYESHRRDSPTIRPSRLFLAESTDFFVAFDFCFPLKITPPILSQHVAQKRRSFHPLIRVRPL
ncbi:unnamed protein product, partial [Brassica oleracea var. botrytis]